MAPIQGPVPNDIVPQQPQTQQSHGPSWPYAAPVFQNPERPPSLSSPSDHPVVYNGVSSPPPPTNHEFSAMQFTQNHDDHMAQPLIPSDHPVVYNGVSSPPPPPPTNHEFSAMQFTQNHDDHMAQPLIPSHNNTNGDDIWHNTASNGNYALSSLQNQGPINRQTPPIQNMESNMPLTCNQFPGANNTSMAIYPAPNHGSSPDCQNHGFVDGHTQSPHNTYLNNMPTPSHQVPDANTSTMLPQSTPTTSVVWTYGSGPGPGPRNIIQQPVRPKAIKFVPVRSSPTKPMAIEPPRSVHLSSPSVKTQIKSSTVDPTRHMSSRYPPSPIKTTTCSKSPQDTPTAPRRRSIAPVWPATATPGKSTSPSKASVSSSRQSSSAAVMKETPNKSYNNNHHGVDSSDDESDVGDVAFEKQEEAYR